MNRRSMFQLIGGFFSATIASQAKTTHTDGIDRSFPNPRPSSWHWHRDTLGLWWAIKWTGWKEGQGNPYLVGQQVAEPVDCNRSLKIDRKRECLYQSFPGHGGAFQNGGTFDISCQKEQYELFGRYTSMTMSQDDLDLAEKWALSKLVHLIESRGNG